MPSAGDAKVLGINSLPAELLLKILTPLCDPPETKYRPSLLAVCSRWRRLLLATPTIWRSIYIVSSEWQSQDVYERFLLRLEAHLIRSKSQRLKVLLDVEQPQEGASSPDSGFEPDLKPLARLLERWAPFPAWETLDLWQCSQGMANELHLDRMGGFINLEHLYLNSLFDPLLPILTNTITNTFQRFDCRSSHCPFDGQTYVHSIHSLLSRITWLKLPNTFTGSTTGLKLPPNITAACIVGNIPDANFPYVRSVDITPFHAANMVIFDRGPYDGEVKVGVSYDYKRNRTELTEFERKLKRVAAIAAYQ
ncbi:hypothetical protein FRC17_008892 [Serendipita sp. 399]|nr:hypothetical protein FRC17_008892 [Serendipita sp. 399]